MKAMFAALAAALAIGGAAVAQDDPDQSFTPGPPPGESLSTVPPLPTGPGEDAASSPANGVAAEAQLSDNWNTGACGFTDTTTFDLAAPTHLTRVSLWYNWRVGESSVGYRIASNGRDVGGGSLTRGGCDPYQGAWCEARDAPAVALPPGRYSIRLDSGRLCQNGGSGGAGFMKAWGYRTAGSVELSRRAQGMVSLAGTWAANDGGTYVLRQDGVRVSWVGTSADGGRTFLNDFEGRIQGERIVGHFVDRPSGAVHSSGDLVLRIEGPNRFVMVTAGGGFGGSVWTR